MAEECVCGCDHCLCSDEEALEDARQAVADIDRTLEKSYRVREEVVGQWRREGKVR